MKMVSVNGRECWVAECDAPKDAVVILHALGMTALEMFGCVRAQRFADAGIMAVCPPSNKLLEWDYSVGSLDSLYVDAIGREIYDAYESVERVHLVGFSNGGDMVATVALFGLARCDSYTQVCATLPKSIDTSGASVEDPVRIWLGSEDSIVPADGNGHLLSVEDVQAVYRAAGAACSFQVFNGGHSWPGGVAPPAWEQKALGGWPGTPDMTQEIIDAITGQP